MKVLWVYLLSSTAGNVRLAPAPSITKPLVPALVKGAPARMRTRPLPSKRMATGIAQAAVGASKCILVFSVSAGMFPVGSELLPS